MKNIIYITGHRNPDSDSICSALAYAEFKSKTQKTPAMAIRLGELNNETKFILDYFGVEAPKLIKTVRTQVSDLDIDTVAPISPDISLKMAWSIMKKNNVKTLPVVDENDRLVGIASVSNLASSYLDIWDNYILAKSNTKLENILDTLSAKVEYLHEEDVVLNGKIAVANMSPDIAKTIIEEGDIVICGDREELQHCVVDRKVSLMIITGNKEPLEGIIDKARKVGCTIISTPYDTFTTSRLITQSIPISHVMTKNNLISFDTADFVDEIKDIMLETRYRSYPVLDENNKVIGSVSRYHLINQRRKKVILLDHNEKAQSVDGIEDAEVLEIIDHHRIADIQTGLPIYFRNEPVGSTSTIVASIFFENGIRPSKKIAGVLCGAIISDTLLLKSPTATLVDEIILKRLAQIADIDIEDFAKQMFKAATSLEGKSAKELFYQDFKTFTIGDIKIGVAQVTTTYIEGFNDLKQDLLKLMNNVVSTNDLEMITLMITDIFNGGSLFLVAGNKDLFIKAFSSTLKDDAVYLDGVVSRKKQVIPPLTDAISQMK
ncbi:putative manganase-dependent inorganic pyrophosphatase [Clostridium argentinense CDC 2741]|uniref:inorganic diphosphatase n=1 Tax=Clostridium argentinense CDC 2741 TaxID=1418104 RepID=A0A0C1U654_9CLOT|nr:putative manganese-dependent inorganic diphosphatase [Clostridium argentinense]ARC85282.1 inorganic pyrophosphatase [Clostridium argentinense]KIE47248.1 putative manganase-dependent inorganic pyrophosphatase [Clostridium argentinense CDC 2741]NFF40901.1 putative manganese-dependent inorganic diphosphatase [Clostridium argentinense]NFP51388.1 putative manganese-dependent inorganic diphosphatase [Clostridium argentinense]NFP73426.1 putative manganese-dependent inorganic diphosphatase [Clostri